MAKSEKHNKENDKLTQSPDIDNPTATTDRFLSWLHELPQRELASWERFPDIGLYMDQVLTLMDRQVAMYKRDGEDKLLTQPMINNYTKDGLLPRATDKKYTPTHLALLTILCSLKPVLSIADLSSVLQSVRNGTDDETLYNFFLSTQTEALDSAETEIVAMLESLQSENGHQKISKEETKIQLARIALQTAIEARVRIMMTQKIIDCISEKPQK